MDIVYVLAALLLWTQVVKSQNYDEVSNAGTDFYLMFLPNLVESEYAVDDQMAVLACNPNGVSAVVNLEMPLLGASYDQSDVLLSGQCREFRLAKEAMHRAAGLGTYGIHVTATEPVTVVGVNRQPFSVDTYLAIPRDGLGVGYIGASYTANLRSQIGIVATLDDTKIRVTLPARTTDPDFVVIIEHNGGYYSNAEGTDTRFDIRLNQDETFLLTSKGDLTAIQLRSNRRIAVFGGNVRAKIDGNSRDHLVEQLLPVYSWQTEWYTVPTPHRERNDKYRVLSNTAANIVNIQLANGTNLPQALIPTASHFVEIEMPEGPPQLARFTCSARCMVYQVSSSVPAKGVLGDPSMFIASNPDQFGSYKYIIQAPETSNGNEFDNNTVVMMSRDKLSPSLITQSGTSTLTIDWQELSDWGLFYALVQLPELQSGESVIIRQGSGNDPFVCWLHGRSDRESYAHPLGFSITSPECLGSDRSVVVPGDAVDNDCDSLIDEEEYDGIDNDGDGLIDEDTAIRQVQLSSGRDYMIMYMENRVDFPVNPPMELFIGGKDTDSQAESTNVTITYPLTAGGRDSFTIHVFPREVHKISFNHSVMQQGTSLEAKSIMIHADHDLVVYGINKEQYSADGFLALPTTSFGMEYYVVCYYPPTTGTEFAIVAPEDDTVVRITFPSLTHTNEVISVSFGGGTYTNEETLEVTMQSLETLQIQDRSGDLSGTLIESSKPVGVFSGNIRTFVTYNGVATSGSRDHLVEQLPPVSAYGTRFAMMTTPSRSVGDFYKIITSQDDANITICSFDGTMTSCRNAYVEIAGCHEYLDEFASDRTFYVQSNVPILIVQITRSQEQRQELADPAMMYIAPLEQYSKDYTFLTPTISNPDVRQDYRFHNLMVITENSSISGLRIDGNATSFSGVQWMQIPNMPWATPEEQHNLVAASVQLPFALHTLTHTDPSVVYMGLLYGVADRESYGFPIGLKLDDLRFCSTTPSVVGDQIDNDCDEAVDEEICGNEIDDDNDGRYDEDCAYLPTAETYLAVFMENTVEPPAINYPLRLYGASYTEQVVRISTPNYTYYDGSTYDRTMLINGVEILNFGLRPDIRHIGSGISNRGVVVKSEHLIDLFGSNEERFSHDCFLTLPAQNLGTEYYTVHYSPSFLPQEFAVTPLEDDTTISVTLSSDLVGTVYFEGAYYTASQTFTFTLGVGGSAQIQTDSYPGIGLTGSRVTSDKPIALFSGNVRTMVDSPQQPLKSREHLAEQLLPYNLWASVYYAPTSPLRNGDIRDVFLFVTKEPSTLTIQSEDGTITSQALSPRTQNLIPLRSGDDRHYRFSATEPFQVVRVTWSWIKPEPEQTDPSMLLLLPNNLWKNKYSFALPLFSGGNTGGDYINVIQLVIDRTKTANVQLDGKGVVGTWNRIGTSNYATINIEIGHKERVALSHLDSVNFMCYLYGGADRESYAMPCGIDVV